MKANFTLNISFLACSINVRYVFVAHKLSAGLCTQTFKSLFHVKKKKSRKELPQHCSFNHLEICFVARKHLKRFFTPSLNLLAVTIVCPHCPKIACVARCHRRAPVISRSLSHYSVTTVWLRVWRPTAQR